jgi:stress responsive alpha/beta barrel protein
MMLHVVLFRPKPNLGESERRELAKAFADAIDAIPSIKRARIGRRRTHGRPYEQLMREDYTHAAILEFDDLGGLKAYLEHPMHAELGSRFFDCFDQALMYDFDVRDGHAGLNALIEDEEL